MAGEPAILGDLKLPGLSSYLHPDGDYIIGVGVDGDDAGNVWGAKVALFDVSDLGNPVLADYMTYDGWAPTDHKAFMMHDDTISVPVPMYDKTVFHMLRIDNGTLRETATHTHDPDGFAQDHVHRRHVPHGGRPYNGIQPKHDIPGSHRTRTRMIPAV